MASQKEADEMRWAEPKDMCACGRALNQCNGACRWSRWVVVTTAFGFHGSSTTTVQVQVWFWLHQLLPAVTSSFYYRRVFELPSHWLLQICLLITAAHSYFNS